jgi:hypothetical protein
MHICDRRTYFCDTCVYTEKVRLTEEIAVTALPSANTIPCRQCQKPAHEVTHVIALYEWIGDFSQSIYECSYNEDEVRHAWINYTLNEQVLNCMAGNEMIVKERMGQLYQEDGNYQDTLTRLVKAVGAWTPEWGYVILSPLTEQERSIIR